MRLLDWFGDSKNKSKVTSIFRFLKDWWTLFLLLVLWLFLVVLLVIAVVALAVGFLPKLIDTVKMLFGFGKKVDEEIAKNEKDLEGGEGVKLDEQGCKNRGSTTTSI